MFMIPRRPYDWSFLLDSVNCSCLQIAYLSLKSFSVLDRLICSMVQLPLPILNRSRTPDHIATTYNPNNIPTISP